MSRTQSIHNRFATQCQDLPAVLETFDAATWATLVHDDPTNLHRPFGFAVPFRRDAEVIVQVCPELVALQSAELDDETFTDYLNALEWHIDVHIVHLDLPIAEAEEIVDRRLAEDALGSMALMNSVQARALDQT